MTSLTLTRGYPSKVPRSKAIRSLACIFAGMRSEPREHPYAEDRAGRLQRVRIRGAAGAGVRVRLPRKGGGVRRHENWSSPVVEESGVEGIPYNTFAMRFWIRTGQSIHAGLSSIGSIVYEEMEEGYYVNRVWRLRKPDA